MAAGDEPGAPLDRVFDQPVDLGSRLLVDQRAELGARLEARRNLQPLDRVDERRHEPIRDRALDVDPIGADARLARDAQELHRDRAVERRLEVRVLEHDKGRVAPELE